MADKIPIPATGTLAIDVNAINATTATLPPYSSEIYQEFQFQTKKAPQTTGVGGAYWEHLPLASMPPQFDISIPNSFGNAAAAALSNLSDSFTGLSNTLKTITQDLQNAVCSFNGLVDGLKLAQEFAEDFAESNNLTKIYVRPLGLQPPGTITSLSSFSAAVKTALNETGDVTEEAGKVPLILPAQIPLDPAAIADALGSGGNAIEEFLEGKSFDVGPFQVATGAGLSKLSNDNSFQPTSAGGGFPATSLSFPLISIVALDGPQVEVVIRTTLEDIDSVVTSITIQNDNPANNGTFILVSVINQKFEGTVKLRFENPIAVTEVNPPTSARLILNGLTGIPATAKIQAVLEERGLLSKTAPRTIAVSRLVEVLIEGGVVGVDPDLLEQDKSIATERLARLAGPTNLRVGGIVLVGQAPDLGKLSAKIQGLADMMEFLKPLADQLAVAAAQQLAAQQADGNQTTKTGIEFDPTKVNLAKLDSTKNVGVKDVEAVNSKTKESGILDFELTPLKSWAADAPQPAASNFHAWRSFSPVDLIPELSVLNSAESGISSSIASNIGNAFGTLGDTIAEGQAEASTYLKQLNSQAEGVKNISKTINDTSDKIQGLLNFIKNQVGTGPMKVDGHLIGAKLDLISNDQFADAVISAAKDLTDPNRPAFGPSPSQSVLDSQQALQASLLGQAPPAKSTKIWFGILIFIVGNGRKDLGEQMRTMASLLSMDTSAVDLPPKKKISGPF